jgi:predicted RNA-binding Zn-ribbon protein involved in translation (DUF1610 family)
MKCSKCGYMGNAKALIYDGAYLEQCPKCGRRDITV